MRDSIPGRGNRFISSSKRPDRLWGPPNFYLVGTGALSSGVKLPGHNANTMQLPRTSFPNGFSTLNVLSITDAEVLCTITSLKNKHSTDYDGICNRILKLCGQYVSKPLAYIYNKCLTTGVYPDWLKYARITPLFKKGDRSFISNYRPISTLTGFSKIFEKNDVLQIESVYDNPQCNCTRTVWF
jgi:hypothetical protein